MSDASSRQAVDSPQGRLVPTLGDQLNLAPALNQLTIPDLWQPQVGNLYDYIKSKMKEGTVVLYLNNRILHKKKTGKNKIGNSNSFRGITGNH